MWIDENTSRTLDAAPEDVVFRRALELDLTQNWPLPVITVGTRGIAGSAGATALVDHVELTVGLPDEEWTDELSLLPFRDCLQQRFGSAGLLDAELDTDRRVVEFENALAIHCPVSRKDIR